MTDNPRAVLGDNIGNALPQLVSDAGSTMGGAVEAWLNEHKTYGGLPAEVAELIDEASDLITGENGKRRQIVDDDDKNAIASMVKRMRTLAKRLDAMREGEKTPYLGGASVVDNFFFGQMERLSKRTKTGRDGASDILAAMVTEYDQRKLAEARARLEAERREQERVAREAQEAAAKAQREAEEARLKADRARAEKQRAEKSEAAALAQAEADRAALEAAQKTIEAQHARLAATTKSADLTRTRSADGTLSTMADEGFATVVDRDLLDKAALWPYLKDEAIQQALTAWAKLSNYTKPMAGAEIGRKAKSVIR